ncbi:MAG: hypothetical protein KC649_00395 [Candidatus Omnitrophica bacterium]|nr:hypothetical protein [Candidatus Omnitrophota bacterium]
MKHFSWIVSFSIFLWVLPLGFLIQPSMEQISCGGKRAMHMCTGQIVSKSAVADTSSKSGVEMITSGTAVNPDYPAASGGSADYLRSGSDDMIRPSGFSEVNSNRMFSGYHAFLSLPSPVPKTAR